jgi:flagellar hook-associated protein 2
MGVAASRGLISGIDFNAMISQLMAIERKPLELMDSKKAGLSTKIEAFRSINLKLISLHAAAEGLNKKSNFNTLSVNVQNPTDKTILSATAANNATLGTYKIRVSQIAQAHKIASQGFADANTTAIASSSGSFAFKVGASGAVTTISVTASTTLEGLRDAINSANAGVTASILNDGTATNPHRLVLTSNNSGSANDIQITTNNTNLDFTNKKIEAPSVSLKNSGTYTGTVTSNTAESYTGTTNKTYLVKITTAGTAGSAKYKYSTDGGITWDDNSGAGYATSTSLALIGTNTENVKIAFSDDSSSLSVGDEFSVDVFNPTLQSAQDAILTVDNLVLTKSSNSISDVIQGVTLDVKDADSTKDVTVTVSQSTDNAKGKIQKFVDSYTEVLKAVHEQFLYDPKKPDSKPLRGDNTLRDIQRKLKSIVTGVVPGLENADLNGLSAIGLKSDSKNGTLSIDDSVLTSTLLSSADEMMKIFVGEGTPSDTSIKYEGRTTATQAGEYSVNITRVAEQAIVEGDQAIQASGLTAQELLTFTFYEDATNSAATPKTFNVTLTAGSTINQVVNTLNSAFKTQGVDLTASNNSGKLRVASNSYGDDYRLTVVSDKASAAAQTGIGQVPKTDTGVDIAGFINSHLATGKGKTLTAAAGFKEEGLQISSTTTTTGLKGTIAVSDGIAHQIQTYLKKVTDPDDGTIKSKQDSLQKIIDDTSKQITRTEDRLVKNAEALQRQMVQLEKVLRSLNSQSNFLNIQLSQLPSISSSRG